MQLESARTAVKKASNILFQSHIGAIRIQRDQIPYLISLLFQSHIGAIRILKDGRIVTDIRVFQSHIGAIRMCIKAHRIIYQAF